VGKLLAWLDNPLPKNQPDPGPLQVKAVMDADGARISLKEAFIDGAELKVKATGSFDGSGDVAKFVLDLDAGVLDIDRYLPPAVKSAGPAGAAPVSASDDFLAALPDQPFDLSLLKNGEGRVSVKVLGLKALGFEVGEIALAASLKNGLLDARLDKFRLYGGGVTGAVKLDGASDALGVDASLRFDRIDVGRLAAAALGSGVAGIASGTLRAKGRGKNLRAMVTLLNTGATLELAGIDLKEARLLSEAALSVETAGFERPATMKARVVYNQEKVAFDVAIAALKPALMGQVVDLTAALTSDPLTARYSGKVQNRPIPGLAGNLDLQIPSVAKLLAWLDNPLPKNQPDPGPLGVKAVIAIDGAKLALEEAVIEGKALKATAMARLDGGQKVKRFDVNIEIHEADLNAYLPARNKKEKETVPETSKEPSGWNEEPIDVSALRQAEGQATVKIGRVRYRELDITEGLVSVTLNEGVLNAVVDGLRLAGGGVDLRATLDASGKAPAINYQVNVVGVQARPILKTFADTDLLSGTTALRFTGSAHGISQKRMVKTLNGSGRIRFTQGAIHGINIAHTLRKAQTLGLGQESEQKTDFAELSGSFTITKGVLDNRDLKMRAPVLRLTGKGLVPMPPRTIDYEVEANLVASLQGQGGDNALAGLPIPITVKGSWDDPSIATDWKSVFAMASAIPGRIARMPVDLLEFGKSLGIPLPVPGLSGGGDKTGGVGGILGGFLKMIPGVTGSQPQETEQPTQQPAQEQPKQQQAPDPLNTLKNFFGN
jgi:AsmA protein